MILNIIDKIKIFIFKTISLFCNTSNFANFHVLVVAVSNYETKIIGRDKSNSRELA